MISSCGEFVLGGTVGTRVTSRVVSNTDGAVLTDRSLSTGAATFAHIHEMVRQQGDIRLYVQARYADAADEQDALTSTRALFTAASTAAFSAG